MALMIESASGQQHGKVAVAVNRPVAHPAAEHDQGVVEDLGFLQTGKEVAELGREKGFHHLELADPIV